jgi:AcrR family transcriptional regulator
MVYRRTPNVRARDARTRAGVIAAARAVVASSGLAGTNVAEVATTAGVGIGTVYRCFPSKSELLCEVVRDVCAHELAVVRSVAAAPSEPGERAPDGGAAQRLAAVVAVFARRALRSGRTAYAMIIEPGDAEVEVTRLEIRAELAEVFAAVIREGIEAGELPRQDSSTSGAALVGAVSEVLVGPLSPVTADLPHEAVDALLADLVDFAVRAVGGATSARSRVARAGVGVGVS